MEGLEEKERLRQLEEMFRWWKAADRMELQFFGKGWAKATLQITEDILSSHHIPMVVGKEIESAASKVGFLAAMTLANDDEYVVYSHDAQRYTHALLEPTVLEEEYLVVTATVVNDRLAKADLVSVIVKVESIYDRRKANYIFFYRVLPREKMELKLLELQNLANRAKKAAH